MATEITKYYLQRLSPYTMMVTIFDSTVYAGYQCYVDNILQVTRLTKSFVGSIKPNQKVDILGCTSHQLSIDHSDMLSDANGDKVVYYMNATYISDLLYIFWDNGTGTIDYTTPLDIIDTSGLLPNEYWMDDFLHWDTDNMIWMTTDHFVLFKTYDEYGSLRLVITKRLNTGNYKFAFQAWTFGGAGPSFLDEAYVLTRPNEIIPTIASYNPSTDTLTINANSTDVGATFNVYASSLNGDLSTINTTTAIGSGSTSTVVVTGIKGGMSTLYGSFNLLVRETQNSLQEENWNVIIFTLVNGNWINNIPGSPSNLSATLLQGNIAQLTWYYTSRIKPDGFYIYDSSGAINYAIPSITVVGGNRTGYRYTVGEIFAPTTFAVRAYIGSITDSNTNIAILYPENIPTSPPYGTLETTWTDV